MIIRIGNYGNTFSGSFKKLGAEKTANCPGLAMIF
jgi:hypothetical protein